VNPCAWAGTYDERIGPVRGRFVQGVLGLVEDLRARGRLPARRGVRARLPHAGAAGTPLLYTPSGLGHPHSQLSERLAGANEDRSLAHRDTSSKRSLGKVAGENVDWALSRERYWGYTEAVWRGEGAHVHCSGPYFFEELVSATAVELRPAPSQGRRRLPLPGAARRCDVYRGIDVWFDSGSMPVAQVPRAFENKEECEAPLPRRLICRPWPRTRAGSTRLLA